MSMRYIAIYTRASRVRSNEESLEYDIEICHHLICHQLSLTPSSSKVDHTVEQVPRLKTTNRRDVRCCSVVVVHRGADTRTHVLVM